MKFYDQSWTETYINGLFENKTSRKWNANLWYLNFTAVFLYYNTFALA